MCVVDGTITITAVAGSGTIEYSLDGGLNWTLNSSFTGLAAGSYNIYIRNVGGTCFTPYLLNPVVLTAPNSASIVNVAFRSNRM